MALHPVRTYGCASSATSECILTVLDFEHSLITFPVQDYSWILPDDDLPRASQILTQLGLPRTPHSKLKTRVEGDYHTKGLYHRISKSTSPAFTQHIVLYPASFFILDLSRCRLSDSVISFGQEKHLQCTQYLVPPPQAVYSSLIRMMQRYPSWGATRTCLNSELQELIDYHLLQVESGYVDRDDDELVQSLDLDGRTARALEDVHSWAWADDERWIPDALSAILLGSGSIEYLPWDTASEAASQVSLSLVIIVYLVPYCVSSCRIKQKRVSYADAMMVML